MVQVKNTWLLSRGLAGVLLIAACGDRQETPAVLMTDVCLVTKVTLTPQAVSMHVGDSTVVHGQGAANCSTLRVTVQRSLSDSSIAVLRSPTDSTAIIVARSPGAATLRGQAAQDPAVYNQVVVSVNR